MDRRSMRRTLRDVRHIFHGNAVDRDAVTRCAEELYWAFRVTPMSVWQAPRQAENYQAMIARHEVTEPQQRRAIALALARRFGGTPEKWQSHVDEWGVLGTLTLMALPPAVRDAYLAGEEKPAGYLLEPSSPAGPCM